MAADPAITPHVAGYLAMTALPSSVAPAQHLARTVYQSGWRPPMADGPTRDELLQLGQRVLAVRPPRPARSRDRIHSRPTAVATHRR
jgi:hypothetical protein